MNAISTRGLSKTYKGGTAALSALDLEVRCGEVFGFLGPNGAGKTTTIQLLLNFIRPTAGQAFLFDCPVTDTAPRRRLGYLPESVDLHDYYSGRQLLLFYGGLQGQDADADGADALLTRVGLQDVAEKPVSQYSKGMLQRLGLAQAMLNDPDLLILDEPTSNLDPVGRRDFRDILLELKSRGKTVFISSHILSEVESVCDRVAIMQQGRLRRQGTLEELSGSRGARLTVEAPPAAALAALTATQARVSLEQGRATIHCADETQRQEVEALLQQHGVAIAQIAVETQSLEDIFFAAIAPEDTP